MHTSQVAARPIKFRSSAVLGAPAARRKASREDEATAPRRSQSRYPVIAVTDRWGMPWHKGTTEMGDDMRKIFILFALVFALVTGATAAVVTTAVSSDAALALATR
jgi:hypothetical protein